MIYLFRFIFGYVKFTFTGGFSEQFINSCFENGIGIRNVKLISDGISAECSPGSYKKLHTLARQSGGVTRIYKKVGLVFILPSLKYRLGFFVGMLAFVLIISFLNSFVWSVEIVGNSKVSAQTLMYYLEDNGLTVGTMWSSVDRDRLSWLMLRDFDTLAWVHINKDGAKAIVELTEVTPANMEYDEEELEGKTVFRKELEATAYKEQSRVSVRDIQRYYELNFFSVKIPLYLRQGTGDTTSVSNMPFVIKGVSLPISLDKITQTFYSSTPYTLTDEEVQALSLKKLKLLKEQELSDYEIVNESEYTQLDDEKSTAKGAYVLRRK